MNNTVSPRRTDSAFRGGSSYPVEYLTARLATVLAIWNFLRVPPLKENVLLADFFLMTLAFILLNAFMESFFFRRAEPPWMLLGFALFGLRLAARFPVPAHLRFRKPRRTHAGAIWDRLRVQHSYAKPD